MHAENSLHLERTWAPHDSAVYCSRGALYPAMICEGKRDGPAIQSSGSESLTGFRVAVGMAEADWKVAQMTGRRSVRERILECLGGIALRGEGVKRSRSEEGRCVGDGHCEINGLWKINVFVGGT